MFRDRQQAGELLAKYLSAWRSRPETVVLAIPRGGVVVGRAVASELKLPLDIVIVRKLGFPGNPEFALGAVDLNGTITFNEKVEAGEFDPQFLEREIGQQLAEAKRREKLYRAGRKKLILAGKRVILVDDGLATGQTTQAAINYLRNENVKEIILAAPVAAPDTIKRLKELVERIVILEKPANFAAVGQFYQEFPQVSDREVVEALRGEG
jgi:predicted phosphoribosyltransferase